MPPTLAELIASYRVTKGKKFRLADHDPADTSGFASKEKAGAKDLMKKGMARLTELQDKLYAQNRWAVLLIFQAMDAAGKDSAIKHVMSGVNPQGCQVYSFKAPSTEELQHDFLWRTSRAAPWFVVPADNKWFTRLVVMAAVVDALDGLGLQYPKAPAAQTRALKAARAELKG